MYESLNNNKLRALGVCAESAKMVLVAMTDAEIPESSYWVVPWGATQAGYWD